MGTDEPFEGSKAPGDCLKNDTLGMLVPLSFDEGNFWHRICKWRNVELVDMDQCEYLKGPLEAMDHYKS